MSEYVRYITRPAKRQAAILKDIRQKILTGRIKVGSRLPTHRELERAFKAGRKTIETVMKRLSDDGFIVARGRAGTFVSDTPPHVSSYGLVFPMPPGESGWTHFHTTLQNEAAHSNGESPFHITCYYGGAATGTQGYATLLRGLESHCLAGLIFAPTGEKFLNTPLAGGGKLPSIQIGGSGPCPRVVNLDLSSLVDQAVAHLKGQGRANIAFVCLEGSYLWMEKIIRPVMQTHGLEYRRRWIQSVSRSYDGWLENVFEQLFYSGQDRRPDALVLLDDHLVPAASKALLNLGLSIPRDIEVVAHANFPSPTESPLPFFRVGFDISALLGLCLSRLGQYREHPVEKDLIKFQATVESDRGVKKV